MAAGFCECGCGVQGADPCVGALAGFDFNELGDDLVIFRFCEPDDGGALRVNAEAGRPCSLVLTLKYAIIGFYMSASFRAPGKRRL